MTLCVLAFLLGVVVCELGHGFSTLRLILQRDPGFPLFDEWREVNEGATGGSGETGATTAAGGRVATPGSSTDSPPPSLASFREAELDVLWAEQDTPYLTLVVPEEWTA